MYSGIIVLQSIDQVQVQVFEVPQTFDSVWHQDLICKIVTVLPDKYFKLLTSYLTGKTFRLVHSEIFSLLFPITVGAPQGSVLGPLLELII